MTEASDPPAHTAPASAEQVLAVAQLQRRVNAAEGSLDEIMTLFTTGVQELIGGTGAVVEMVDGEQMVYRAVSGSTSGHLGLRLARNGSISGLCVRERKVLYCEDSEVDPRVDREACRRVAVRSLVVAPILYRGSAVGVVKVASDQPSAFHQQSMLLLELASGMLGAVITDLEGRRAEQDSAAKSQFLAVMSHELRTPLNSILGFAQLLDMGGTNNLTEKQHRHVRNILAGGRDLLGLVEDVLTLSNLEAGTQELAADIVNLDEVALEAARMVRGACAEKAIELSVNSAEVAAVGDRKRLLQVALNLLSNAIKFTDQGGNVTVSVRSDGDLAYLSVEDDGIGIPSQDRVRIFERFVQLDTGSTRTSEGAGLGLTLSKAFVEGMGGNLIVRERPGGGSCFEAALPAPRPQESSERAGRDA